MVPPALPGLTDQVGAGRIGMTLPLASRPTAVNCWLASVPTATGLGVTVMVAKTPELTVTVAKPETLPLAQSAVLHALTVLAKVPATMPAVNRPELLMAPPLATTDHVGVIETVLPLASLPTAVNCWVPLMARTLGLGVTVIDARAPAVTVNPIKYSDQMRKYGGFIPGIRPGRNTSEHINRILTRLTFVGGCYLALVCLIPEWMIAGIKLHKLWGPLGAWFDVNAPRWLLEGLGVTFYFGGTSLLIVVGVAMDTVSKVEAQLVMRHYEGFAPGAGRIRGRRG